MFPKSKWFLQDEATEAGGGTAAPATNAVVETPATADTSSVGSGEDWLEMSQPDEDGQTPQGQGSPVSTVAKTPATIPVPATPVATAAAAPVVVAPPAVTPAPTTVAPTSPAVPDGQQTEVPADSSTQPTLSQMREQELTRLQGFYALSEDDARMAVTQPEAVLPKLAATLHLNVVDSVVNAVLSRVPEIVHATQQRASASAKNESEFYGQWPMLNKPEYKQVVYNAVAAYRQLNPKADMNEVVRAAGLQALLHLRLPIPRELLQQETPAPAPSYHQPALGTSVTTHQPRSDGTANPFEVMSQEFSDWDKQP